MQQKATKISSKLWNHSSLHFENLIKTHLTN